MQALTGTLLMVALFATSLTVSAKVVLRSSVQPPGAWVGQRVILSIDVLSDDGWSQITRFGDVDLANAYLIRSDSQGIRLQELIDSIAYTGQRYELSVYPQVAGRLEIPAIPVDVSTTIEGKAGPVRQQTVPAIAITVKTPPGAEAMDGLISTRRLSADQTWQPEPDSPRVGDAFRRVIRFEAEDVSAMAFTPLHHAAIPGVGIYVAEPMLKDRSGRGSLSGTRTETVTYVLESAGEVQIPDVALSWWNLDTLQLQHVKLPGRHFKVAPGATSVSGPGASHIGVQSVPWLPVALSLALTYLVWHFRVPMKQRYLAWVQSRQEAEVRHFRQALRSVHSGDARAALRDIMRWIDRVNTTNKPARLCEFFAQYAGAGAQDELDQLLRKVAKGGQLADPKSLGKVLKSARQQWHAAGLGHSGMPHALPELNRVRR